jgi:cytochrome d ubiquinol oxidase subunit I
MVEVLSRVQFAFTIAFHFVFVPLTVGLIILIVIFEARYFKTDDHKFKKLSEYFSDIFLINYVFGIVTGIAMTVQFGTNWGAYSIAMGDVFGGPLILEAIIAFFLESTFTGIWLFRRNKITKGMRLFVVSMILVGTTLSALWIITANGFMQNPVGATWDGVTMTLTDFSKVFFNPYAWYMLIHNHLSAILLSAFAVLAISSWHMLYGKEQDKEVFIVGAKYASWTLLITSILIPITGSSYLDFINGVQPTKVAMINGDVTGGLYTVVRIAYGFMISMGTIFVLFGIYTVVFFKMYLKSPQLQKYYMYLVPLPYLVILSGWMVTEMGRQPYIIYNTMYVSDAISQVPVAQIWFSVISITLFYMLLFVLDYKLSITRIKKGLVYEGSEVNES